MEFSRQEYWSGLPFPPPGDLPDPEVEPESLMSPALAGRFFTTSTTWNDIVPTVSHNKDKDERKRCEQKVQSIHMVRIINNFQHSKGDIMRGNAQSLSHCHVQFFAAPWIVALKAPLSMEFSRQEYWSGLPFST